MSDSARIPSWELPCFSSVVASTDNLANVGNAVVVIMLYVFVLKSLMLSLRGTARRTEYMLLGFPEDFAGEGPLKRFFMRANDFAVSA